MLEIRHLTKVYTVKGGAETCALDDVSVSFGETGLVFLLGKSGSGKSTLLNLAGGLDAPTSGEVIVMGKSSKDFSGADFDSYRNTFVGFIFQEYNVLDEFSVEDNVALALELQGKTKDAEKISAILNEVELAPYAKRKPNTLSGGQKQRIAIARALVKDPQIIMADEPTGALDSATGKQVFDTLKKLSATRLVLVVSHDREFAEVYGDRIIELKDGKIVSDVTKEHVAAEEVTENLRRIGNDTLSVQGGTPDERTMKEIEAFLKESDGEILISKGKADIAAFRRVNRIGEDGAREKFEATKEPAAERSDGREIQFIRSRLPVLKAMRIGASGLKLKPFRLILTILLSVAAFIMFGLASTMMLYNERSVLVNSFLAADYDHITLDKRYEVRRYNGEEYMYTTASPAKFTPADIKSFGEEAIGVYSIGLSFSQFTEQSYYYVPQITRLTVAEEGHPLAKNLLAGRLPEADDEICVSSYFASCAAALGFLPVGENGVLSEKPATISSPADLVGQKLVTNEKILNICGVFDSGELPHKYDEYKAIDVSDNYFDYNIELNLYAFRSYLGEGLHSLAITTQALADTLLTPTKIVEWFDNASQSLAILKTDEYGTYASYFMRAYAVYDPDGDRPVLPIVAGKKIATLQDDELIVSLPMLAELYGDALPDESAKDYTDYKDFINTAINFDNTLGDEEKEAAVSAMQSFLASHTLTKELFLPRYEKDGSVIYDSVGSFDIVGGYLPDETVWNYGVYCSENAYPTLMSIGPQREETKYVPEPDATFDAVLVPFEHSAAALNRLFDRVKVTDPETDVFYTTINTLYSEVRMASDIVNELSIVFLVIGLVLAVFSALLLFNFISMSITNKKKEIGILRAVGARGTDVFKIFFSESGIIVGICTILAIIGTTILTVIINNILRDSIGFDVTLFVFGPVPILIMVAVAVAVAVISTFLPVYFAARKKPVESIRAL